MHAAERTLSGSQKHPGDRTLLHCTGFYSKWVGEESNWV